jgi:tetratricopeptide (TPR) repeat protein
MVTGREWSFPCRQLVLMFNARRPSSRSTSSLTVLFCWSLVIIPGLVGAGCKKNPTAQAQIHDKRAKELASNGKPDEAIIEYRREIQSVPTVVAPHSELAKLYLNKREYLSAYREYLTVLKLDPKNREAKESVAEMLLADRKFDDSSRLAKELAADNPNDTRGLMIEAASAFGKKDMQESRSLTEQVLKLEPTNSHALLQLALMQAQANQMGPAEDNLKKAIVADPKWTVPVAVLAALYIQQKAPQKAEALLRDRQRENPEDVSVNVLLVTFLASQKRLGEAEELSRKISSIGDKDPFYRGYLARYYISMGKPEKSVAEYQRILASHPDDIFNRRGAAALFTALGRANDAQQMIEVILKEKPGDTQVLLIRGQLRLDQARLDEAIQDLQKFVTAEPKSALGHYLMAEAYTRQGNASQAESQLRTATEIAPKMVQPRLMLGALETRQGRMDQAVSDLGNAVAEKPGFVMPYVMHSMAIAGEGHLDEAEKDLLPKVEEFPQPDAQALTYRSLGWIKYFQRKPAEAQNYAAKSYALDPNSRDSLYLLGLTYLSQKKTDAGLTTIRAKAEARPTWAPGYEVLGRMYLFERRYPEAEAALKKAVQIDPNSSLAQFALGEAAVSQKKLDEAIDIYTKLSEKQPRLAGPQILLGQINDMKGTPNEGIPHYKKALEIEPDNAVVKNNLAWIYAENGGNIDVALHLAQEAKEQRPDDVSISDTLGWIYVKKQSYEPAIRLLRTCVAKNPADPAYQYHLGMAYYYSGDKASAKDALQASLKLKPDAPQASEEKRILETLNQ